MQRSRAGSSSLEAGTGDAASPARSRHPRRLGAALGAARFLGAFVLAGAAFLPVWAFLAADPSLVAKAVVVAMVPAAALFPAAALLVCAGLVPLAWPLGTQLGSFFHLGEALVPAYLSGWALSMAVRRAPAPDRHAGAVLGPALLIALVVAASSAVQLSVQQPFVDHPWGFARAVVSYFLQGDYFRERSAFPGVAGAALPLEGIGLFVATVTLVCRDRAFGPRVLAMVALGAVGAALLSIEQLLVVSLQAAEFWPTVQWAIRALRIVAVHADPNAAGSYLAMASFVSLGLAFEVPRVLPGSAPCGERRRRPRFGWCVAAATILVALWLTGSRSAIVAVILFAAVIALVPGRPSRPNLWGRVGVATATCLLLVGMLMWLTAFRPLPAALTYRARTTEAALRMFADRPLFGVGVGAFYIRSAEYFEPDFRAAVPRENAHNNYLQVLAELGLIGAIPFVWLLAVVARRLNAEVAARRAFPPLIGAACGLGAFGLTCLTGHPLLIQEVARPFWMVFGVVAGLVGAGVAWEATAIAESRALRLRWAAVAFGLFVVGSVPPRARAAVADANLRAASIGLSGWEADERGESFRRLLGPAQFHVPADATAMRLAFRIEPGGPACADVEIRLDHVLANRVHVQGTQWIGAALILPPDHTGRRFRSVQLVVAPAALERAGGRPPVVRVGPVVLSRPERR